MYTWYEKAETCIAFLPDSQGALGDSKWFTRGWTLQELIAPHELQFRDSDWQILGDKFELAEEIAARTNIPVSVLRKEKDVSEVSVGERMCWMAARKTTRAEDVAYCLLGLFDINMPMLYGEGGVKAFLRLQEEIMKQNTDMSIFAWTAHGMPEIDTNFSGLLAISPKCFSACKGLITKPHVHGNMREFFTSNRGIRFDLYLGRDPETGCFLLPLSHDSPNQRDLAVYLRPMASDLFVRAFPNRLATISIIDRQIAFHVMKALSRSQAWKIARAKLKFPDLETSPDAPFRFLEAAPRGSWDPTENVMYAGHTDTFSGILRFYARHQGFGATFIVACEFRESTWRTALLRTFDKDNVMWYRLFDAERARFYGEDEVQEVSMRDRGMRINLCLAFEPAGVARLTCDPESIWLYGGGRRARPSNGYGPSNEYDRAQFADFIAKHKAVHSSKSSTKQNEKEIVRF
jgi:hypothetical protein